VKVLWISNAPTAPSGYGSQTRQVGRRIVKAGYGIEYVANDGTRGDREWEGQLVRGSSGVDRYSRDSLREDYERSEADWVVCLYDQWVFTTGADDPFEHMPRMAGWVPIDHFPVPHVLFPWLANGHTAIAMSQYGYEQLTELRDSWATVTNRAPFEVRYAPHALEDWAHPVPTAFREAIDVPDDAFLVGIVAANTDTLTYDRKGFGDMTAALAEFMRRHSDAYLYLHTLQKRPGSMDLPFLLQQRQVPVERIAWVDQYAMQKQGISDEHMAQIYSSFDLLLSTSRGEGFGLPTLEAQACGVPVIASNWTAQAELVRGTPWTYKDMSSGEYANGWLVYCDPDYDPRQGADFGKPMIGQIIQALEKAYSEWQHGRWQERRDAAVERASHYRADAVFEQYWKPILEEMAERLPIPLNRESRRARKAG
jgi:glycosyltransferase involved in cell wall biosynthesis